MSDDLTILFYTASRVPDPFARNIRMALWCATDGAVPIISISQKPLAFGDNICLGPIGFSLLNIYRQALIGALKAKTKYVAMCEDDCLYTPEHFTCYRPKDDVFGYNANRWTLFTWSKTPLFSFRNRAVFSQCIAPRALLVEALTERFQHVGQPVMVLPGDMPPELSERQIKFFAEPGRYEGHLGVTIRNMELFHSPDPNVVFSHADALGMAKLGVKKRMGHPRLEHLEPWGAAADVMAEYFGEEEMVRQKGYEKWVNA